MVGFIPPIILPLLMWCEVIYCFIVGENIIWYEWLIIAVCTIGYGGHFLYVMLRSDVTAEDKIDDAVDRIVDKVGTANLINVSEYIKNRKDKE